jgi:hypothetical protein
MLVATEGTSEIPVVHVMDPAQMLSESGVRATSTVRTSFLLAHLFLLYCETPT